YASDGDGEGRAAWERQYAASPLRDDGLETSTLSGVEVRPLYTSGDLADRDEELPGQYPYTRGIHAAGYRGRLWTMRQFSGFATAAQPLRHYLYHLTQVTTW